jgi:hypothetical protein
MPAERGELYIAGSRISPGLTVYHRVESPTQTRERSIENFLTNTLTGGSTPASYLPRIRAYPGPLPADCAGIEFETDIPPESGGSPTIATWLPRRKDVSLRDGIASMNVVVTRLVLRESV